MYTNKHDLLVDRLDAALSGLFLADPGGGGQISTARAGSVLWAGLAGQPLVGRTLLGREENRGEHWLQVDSLTNTERGW